MAEAFSIPTDATKEEKYTALLPMIASVTEQEPDFIANLANITAMLRQTFGWWWVGFYLVKNNTLVLAPFQGPMACTRIAFGKGVCGTAWKEQKTLLVPNVHQFVGHIACSSASVAEIVVPLFDKYQNVIGVLDIDSEQYNVLDHTDVFYLEQIASMITTLYHKVAL